jgi:hypothetical protein
LWNSVSRFRGAPRIGFFPGQQWSEAEAGVGLGAAESTPGFAAAESGLDDFAATTSLHEENLLGKGQYEQKYL